MRPSAVLLVAAFATTASADELIPSPPLAPNVAALPRLSGSGSLVARVNGLLQALDDSDFATVTCSDERRAEDPFRSVEVLSDGPAFLSFLVSTGTYCEGAAHPFSAQWTVNIDLETGAATNLRQFLPPSFIDAGVSEDALAVLFLNAVADLPGDCAQTYARAMREGYLAFDLGLVEADSALLLWPRGLAYAETFCTDLAYVPVDRLREAGFSDRLVQALTVPN